MSDAIKMYPVVRCKLRCLSKDPCKYALPTGEEVEAFTIRLIAMYEVDEGKRLAGENIIFGYATPNAHATFFIVEPKASARFVVGKDYYLDMSPVETDEVPDADVAVES